MLVVQIKLDRQHIHPIRGTKYFRVIRTVGDPMNAYFVESADGNQQYIFAEDVNVFDWTAEEWVKYEQNGSIV